MNNYFNELNAINVSEKTEKKNNLTYLSWAYAWAEAKKYDANANYRIIKNEKGWLYHTDEITCWVEVGVTINNIEHIETLPVMDYKNRSINVDEITSFDVNKAIQRCLTKAIARHGIGLYIYAGEDLPEEEKKQEKKEQEGKKQIVPPSEEQMEELKQLKIPVEKLVKAYKLNNEKELTTEIVSEAIKLQKEALKKKAEKELLKKKEVEQTNMNNAENERNKEVGL